MSSLPHAASATAQLTKRLARAVFVFLAFLRLAPDPLSRPLLPKSPDLLQSPFELSTNGAPKGQARFIVGLVRAGSRCAQHLGEEPRRHTPTDSEREQLEGEDRAPGWLC